MRRVLLRRVLLPRGGKLCASHPSRRHQLPEHRELQPGGRLGRLPLRRRRTRRFPRAWIEELLEGRQRERLPRRAGQRLQHEPRRPRELGWLARLDLCLPQQVLERALASVRELDDVLIVPSRVQRPPEPTHRVPPLLDVPADNRRARLGAPLPELLDDVVVEIIAAARIRKQPRDLEAPAVQGDDLARPLQVLHHGLLLLLHCLTVPNRIGFWLRRLVSDLLWRAARHHKDQFGFFFFSIP